MINAVDCDLNAMPIHPSHDRKQVHAFIVLVPVVMGVGYVVSLFPNYEMLALYVLALGLPLGVMAISLFPVRCPHCRKAMDLRRDIKIAGRTWYVWGCERCPDEWRIKKVIAHF
jgi:hypothetical protein